MFTIQQVQIITDTIFHIVVSNSPCVEVTGRRSFKHPLCRNINLSYFIIILKTKCVCTYLSIYLSIYRSEILWACVTNRHLFVLHGCILNNLSTHTRAHTPTHLHTHTHTHTVRATQSITTVMCSAPSGKHSLGEMHAARCTAQDINKHNVNTNTKQEYQVCTTLYHSR